jgi:hypothetical protein
MTVEIEYEYVRDDMIVRTQLDMAKQIEENRGFPIKDIERIYGQGQLIVRVKTSLPSTEVENMLSDIEQHLNDEAEYVETREV